MAFSFTHTLATLVSLYRFSFFFDVRKETDRKQVRNIKFPVKRTWKSHNFSFVIIHCDTRVPTEPPPRLLRKCRFYFAGVGNWPEHSFISYKSYLLEQFAFTIGTFDAKFCDDVFSLFPAHIFANNI